MKRLLLLIFFSAYSLQGSATHLRGGFISVKRISGLTCDITVTVFTDTGCVGCVLFGGEVDVLEFGDASQVLVPETLGMSMPGFNDVGLASYTIRHTFPGVGRYTISYQEPNRNAGVLNMDNSIGTTFYVETMIDLSIAGFYSTPDFLMGPIFQAKLGSDLSLSAGAISEQDYILLYQFGTPYQERYTPVQNYQLPENIAINPYTGLITWDTKFNNQYLAGEYTFNIRVSLFKEVEGEFYKVCTVTRDIQIILEDIPSNITTSTNTEFDENGRIYIPTNEAKTIKVFYEKTDGSSAIELTAESELSSNSSAFSFISYDSSTLPNIKVGALSLTSLTGIDRENPYLVTVRGKQGAFAKDISILFFTQDVQPKLIDYVELITGTEDDLKLVEAYPNPSTGLFTISVPENQTVLISVRDQTGRLIQSVNSVGATSLDLRHLNSGFYYCSVFSGSTVKQIKLVKN